MRSWVTCYDAPTAHEAHMVKGFLEGRGVPCVLRATGPSMYPVMAFGTKVLVPDEWERVARQWLRRRRRAPRGVVRLRRSRMGA